jgi:hypothetical protein
MSRELPPPAAVTSAEASIGGLRIAEATAERHQSGPDRGSSPSARASLEVLRRL